jgi:hypothetical protein
LHVAVQFDTHASVHSIEQAILQLEMQFTIQSLVQVDMQVPRQRPEHVPIHVPPQDVPHDVEHCATHAEEQDDFSRLVTSSSEYEEWLHEPTQESLQDAWFPVDVEVAPHEV